MTKPRKKHIQQEPPKILNAFDEYEQRLKRDDEFRKIMTKSVFTNDEIVRLVELYCSKMLAVCGIYANTSEESHDLRRFADRIIFLVKSMQ